jgi:hypothetical protein
MMGSINQISIITLIASVATLATIISDRMMKEITKILKKISQQVLRDFNKYNN